MNWKLQEKRRSYDLPESSINSRIGTYDAAGDSPGEIYVEVFADDLMHSFRLSECQLSPEEMAAFGGAWKKICNQAMVSLGFQKLE